MVAIAFFGFYLLRKEIYIYRDINRYNRDFYRRKLARLYLLFCLSVATFCALALTAGIQGYLDVADIVFSVLEGFCLLQMFVSCQREKFVNLTRWLVCFVSVIAYVETQVWQFFIVIAVFFLWYVGEEYYKLKN